jgi:hypothetical protein
MPIRAGVGESASRMNKVGERQWHKWRVRGSCILR